MIEPALTHRPSALAQDIAQLARAIISPNLTVIWFGSWPKGTARPQSDIDIALESTETIPLQKMAALREATDALATLHEIDLIDLRSVGDSVRAEILTHGILL